MTIAEGLIKEIQHESVGTRKVLARVAHFDWSPHEKSMTMGRLAGHVALTFAFMKPIIEQSELAMEDAVRETPPTTADGLVAQYDKLSAQAIELLEGKSNEFMMQPWTFKAGGQAIFTLPKAAAIRMMLLNHLVHHRGQLTVYLRIKDIPVPGLYGPSADEK